MTSSTRGSSPKVTQDHETREDDETRATRRELKQSSISDASRPAPDHDADDSRPDTPAEGLESVASPKKKRAHDQLDTADAKDSGDEAGSVASTESAKDRKERDEPEKKRARDDETSEATPAKTDDAAVESTAKSDETPRTGEKATETSSSAFAASGFAKLAAAPSPFAAFGGPSKGFGSAPASKSETSASTAEAAAAAAAAAPPPQAAAPKLTFGGTSGASPFAGLGAAKSNGFGGGSGFGGGASPFGSALGSGGKISSFAAPGAKPLAPAKTAKPFGAPESDVEESDGGDEGDDAEDESAAAAERALSPEKDDGKKLKLQRVEVETGESGETTMASVRAKMFIHEKEAGWKERGAGMLKINVPSSCVDFDDDGNPIAGSFDVSGLEGDGDEESGKGHKVCRLLMRQDHTMRVILNTEILPAMKFDPKASLKSVGIMFMAFEGPEAKPVSVTMKMSAANSKIFMSEVENIQRELQSR